MSSIIFLALLAATISGDIITTLPSSLVSILTPVSAIIFFIVFPPGPIISLIFSGSILSVYNLGAY